MTTASYDAGRGCAERLLADGENPNVAATVAGEIAAHEYEDVADVRDFGYGVLDVLHDRPHRDSVVP